MMHGASGGWLTRLRGGKGWSVGAGGTDGCAARAQQWQGRAWDERSRDRVVTASAGGGWRGGLGRSGVGVVHGNGDQGRVAVGKAAVGFGQAVAIRSREEWCRHKMSRKQPVGITGQRVQASGGREVLVGGPGGLAGVGRTSGGGQRGEGGGQWNRQQ